MEQQIEPIPMKPPRDFGPSPLRQFYAAWCAEAAAAQWWRETAEINRALTEAQAMAFRSDGKRG